MHDIVRIDQNVVRILTLKKPLYTLSFPIEISSWISTMNKTDKKGSLANKSVVILRGPLQCTVYLFPLLPDGSLYIIMDTIKYLWIELIFGEHLKGNHTPCKDQSHALEPNVCQFQIIQFFHPPEIKILVSCILVYHLEPFLQIKK